MSNMGNFEQLLKLGASDQEPDANDAHIVNIVDWLFQYAFQQRASDIHIEPRREQGTVRFRIDGVLHNVYQFPAQVIMAIVSRLKSLGRMNVAENANHRTGGSRPPHPRIAKWSCACRRCRRRSAKNGDADLRPRGAAQGLRPAGFFQ